MEQNYRARNLKNGKSTLPFFKVVLPRDLQAVLVNFKIIKKYNLDVSKILQKSFVFDFRMKRKPT